MAQLANLRIAITDLIEELAEPPVDTERFQKHLTRWESAADAVGMIANQEEFLLSKRALTCLEAIQDERRRLREFTDHKAAFQSMGMALKRGIDEFARIGHEDLGIR